MRQGPITEADVKAAEVASVFIIGGVLTALGGRLLGLETAVDAGGVLMVSGAVVVVVGPAVLST